MDVSGLDWIYKIRKDGSIWVRYIKLNKDISGLDWIYQAMEGWIKLGRIYQVEEGWIRVLSDISS